MAAPTFVHDLTIISDAESTTNWVALGGAMFALDSDTFIQGSGSIGVQSAVNTIRGVGYNIGSTVDLSGQHLFIWTNILLDGGVASYAEGGVRVRVTGPTVTNYGEWFVGGNDSVWVGRGWRLLVVEVNRPFDATGGTPPARTAIQHVGVVCNWTKTLMVSTLFVDIMRYGTKIAITGGSDGDPITLQETFDTDFVTDPTNNVFGIVTKNRAGVFEINGELRIGTESGAGDTSFLSKNEVVIFQDQPCALNYPKIKAQKGTGTTNVQFGTSVGSGDAKVGINGSVLDRINVVHGREYAIDLSAASAAYVYGTSILRCRDGLSLPTSGTHEVISSSIISSGQTGVGAATVRKSIFSGHGLVDTGVGTFTVAADPVDSGTITIDANAANTYTRTAGGSGSFITDGFLVGMVITMSGFTNTNDNGRKRIKSVTATVITTEPSLILTTETGTGDERVRLEFGFTRSSGSFITDGFVKDMAITPSGFSTSANNLTRVITNVTATVIAVREYGGLAAEAGGGDERIRSAGLTGDGALLWNESIDIQSTSFLGNINDVATAAAIEHPVATSSPYTYDNLTFSGNDFDINNTSTAVDTGSITITVAATAGTLTRSAGDFTTDGFAAGMTITASGFTNSGNNFETKTIDTITGGGTIITVTDSSGLVDETGDADERVQRNITINATNDANPGTSKGQPVAIQNAVTLEINGVTEGTRCYIEAALGGPETAGTVLLSEEADATGTAQAAYNYTSNQPVSIKARLVGYLPFETTGTITTSGLSVTAVWLVDTIADRVETS